MSLKLVDIHKRFGPVHANDGVTVEVEAGHLHGLLGENGAGKSTLMKILTGFYVADSGEVSLDGHQLDLDSPADGLRHGIGMLHQDPLVFLPLSVLDNFVIGSPGPLSVDRKQARRALLDVCSRFGFALDPNASAMELTIGERQQLEIARLLWLGAKVLILDEPTTGISETQRTKLFATLKELAAEGMIVIFVSHKLEEVEQLCTEVTVLRSGKVVGDQTLPCPTEQLIEMMFGEVVVAEQRSDVPLGPPVLTVADMAVDDGSMTMEHVSLEVRAGEVVGLAGLVGSGQRTFLRTIAGLTRPKSGSLLISETDMTRATHRAFLDAGVHYLAAGRLEEGLFRGLTLAEHFVLAKEHAGFFIDWGAAEQDAATVITNHFIKGRPDSAAEELSGGNQQRLLLAMAPEELTLLLMLHPTRGLDIESANWVWSQLLKRREHGTAIVFASSDLDELLGYSDRIAVFFSGEILDVVDASTATVEQLGYLIGGVRGPAS
jgi:general nucleoside transport system ATP-binding protein